MAWNCSVEGIGGDVTGYYGATARQMPTTCNFIYMCVIRLVTLINRLQSTKQFFISPEILNLWRLFSPF
jgi:hypothetical protein